MSILALAFSLGCLISLVLTPSVRRLCLQRGLVDKPDGHRKLHADAIALGGGLAASLATVVTLIGLGLFVAASRTTLSHTSADLFGLLIAALAILTVGVADDAIGLRGRHKLAGQVLSCLIVVASGVVIEKISVFGWNIELGLLSVPFTMLWLLAAINAINLLDGINGLATSIGIINCLALAVMAHVGGRNGHALVAAAFAGSLLGFLRYNFPRASMFLGDAGSMLIGLMVGVISIQTSLKGPGTVLLIVPACLWAIPFFDSFAAIVRRKLTGRSIFSTDRAHLHHRLTDKVGAVRATGIVALACLITAGGALVSTSLKNETTALVCGTALIVVFIASRMFGHAEMRLIASRLGSVGRSLLVLRRQQHPVATQASVRLQGSREWDHLWQSLTEFAEQSAVEQIELDVNAPSLKEGYHAAWKRRTNCGDEKIWRFDMPLMAVGHRVGHIRVTGHRTAECGAHELEKLVVLLDSFEDQLKAVVGEKEARTSAATADTDHELDALQETQSDFGIPPVGGAA